MKIHRKTSGMQGGQKVSDPQQPIPQPDPIPQPAPEPTPEPAPPAPQSDSNLKVPAYARHLARMSTLHEIIHENVREGALYQNLDRNWVGRFACRHSCQIPDRPP